MLLQTDSFAWKGNHELSKHVWQHLVLNWNPTKIFCLFQSIKKSLLGQTYLRVTDRYGQQKEHDDTSRHLHIKKRREKSGLAKEKGGKSLTFPLVSTPVPQQVEKTWRKMQLSVLPFRKKLLCSARRRWGAGLDVCRDRGEQEVRDFKKSEERWGMRASPSVSPPPLSPPGPMKMSGFVVYRRVEEGEEPGRVRLNSVRKRLKRYAPL